MKLYKSVGKPIFDFFVSLILFILSSPILMILTIILFISNGGSPFFLQMRPGYQGKPFRIIKFKTMNDKKDKDGKLLPDIERHTRIGLFLRKKSLDELPQLLNVLAGDISFVGPRPLLMQYLPHYNEKQARRHEVKPGITGWAQVQGRQTISFEERFDLDVWYVDNLSFSLDIKILVRTFINVIKSKGILENEGYWKS